MDLNLLQRTAFTFPAVDNHAHPLLSSQFRHKVPFEAILSEASGEVALKNDAPQTLACFRAAAQLAEVFEIDKDQDYLWEKVKQKRDATEYQELCETFMLRCGIQSILLDDGLGGVAEWAEDWKWHRRFCHTKRMVRIEIEAEKLLLPLLQPLLDIEDLHSQPGTESRKRLLSTLVDFFGQLNTSLTNSCLDPDVVAFKSIACYRGGLNIRTRSVLGISSAEFPIDDKHETMVESLLQVLRQLKKEGSIRLAHGVINEWIVHWALRVAGEYGIPVQFHTGLGDSDISLVHASPAHMQPLIEDYPQTIFVLLHTAYPYTKDAGYLCSIYPNVMLDFGEIFPMVSGSGQRSALREVLELCPTNKILWSTDGHWHPESFYLGTIQARQALFDVLSEMVLGGELTETQAVAVVERALFWNSDRIYKLNLKPDMKITEGFKWHRHPPHYLS